MTWVLNKGKEAAGAVLDAGTKLISGGANFVLDKVVKPTGALVSGVVAYVADDPLKALAQGAAIASGHPELLPLIEGADAVIAGRDMSDVLKATAKAYIMQQAGSYVGKAAGAYAADAAASAGADVASQQLAATVAAGAAGSATVAAVAGRDVMQALTLGGVSAGAGALLGKVDGYNSLPPAAKNAIGAAVMTTLSKGNANVAVINSLIASSGIVADIIKSADPNGTILTNDASKALVTDILMGSASAALTNGNVSNSVRAAMLKNGSNALGDAIKNNLPGRAEAVAAATRAAEEKANLLEKNVADQNSAASSYNNIGAQLQIRIDEQKRLNDAANTAINTYQTKYGEWKSLYDAASSDAGYANYVAKQGYQPITTGDYETGYGTAYVKIVGYDTYSDWETGQPYQVPRYENAPSKETLITQANAKAKEIEPLVAPTDAAVNAANTYTTALNNDYASFYRPELTKYQTELDTLKGQYTTLKKGYDGAVDTFVASTNDLKSALDPIYYTSNRAFVEAMDPNFNADQYRKIAGLPADADVYDHFLGKGQFENLPTNFDAAKAQIGQERTRLISGALAQQGLSMANADPAKVSEMIDKLDAAYGNNLVSLKSASIQDIVNNNTRTLEDLKAEASRPQVEINGRSYGAWDRPDGYTAPAGLKLASLQEMQNGQATSQFDDRGRIVWLVKDAATAVPQWNPETGAADMGTVTITAKRPTTAELYQVYASQEADGTFAKLFNNIAVVAAGGIGQQMQNWSSALALQFNGNMNNLGYQYGSLLVDWASKNSPADLKAQMQNISAGVDRIGKIDGFWNQLKATTELIKQNPGAFLTYVAQETVQEALPTGAGFIAGAITTALSANPAAGVSAAVLTSTVIDGIETLGSTGRDVYTTLRAQGVSEEDARARALMAGWQAAAVTAPSEALANAAVFAPYIKGLGYGANAMLQGVRGAVAEGVSETIETYAQTRITQYATGVPQDHNAAMSQALFAGFVGAGTGGVIMSPVMASGALDIGKDITGKALTWSGLTSGNQVADFNSINGNLVIGKDDKGVDITLAGAMYAGQTSDLGKNVLAAVPEPVQYTQWMDPYVFDASEAKAAAAAEGYTLTDAQAASLAGFKNEAAAAAAARAQYDPFAVNADEARQYLTDAYAAAGFNVKPTDAQVQRFVGQINEAVQQQSVSSYVNQNTMTFDEAKQYLTSIGYTPTDAQVRQFVAAKSEAEQKAAMDTFADPYVVDEGEARAAYKALGIDNPTQQDLAKIMGQYDESQLGAKAQANLETARYNSLTAQLDAISKSANPDPTQIKALQDQINALGGNVTTQITDARNALTQAINDAKAAGLAGDAALQSAINKVAGDLGTTKTDLLTRLGTTETALRSDFATQLGAVQTSITDTRNALTQAINDAKAAGLAGDAALQSAINKVAGDLGTTKTALLTQLGTTETALRNEFSTQLGTVQADITATRNALTQAINDAKAAGLAGDAALQTAINKVAGDLGTTKNDLLTRLGTTETALRNDFATQLATVSQDLQTKFNTLTQGQKDIVTQLTQQGIDLNTAIQQAQQQTQQQITDVQQDVQTKFNTLTQGQKDIVTQLTQQGIDLNTAIDTARRQTAEDLANVNRRIEESQAAVQDTVTKQAEATRAAAARNAINQVKLGNVNTLLGMVAQAPDAAGQQVTVKAPDLSKIGYIYDWSSIFANPSQEKMFASPYGAYASGGAVNGNLDEVNDELLKLLRG